VEHYLVSLVSSCSIMGQCCGGYAHGRWSCPPRKQPEVHGIFHHVGECDDTCDACRADVVYCDGINKIVLDQLLRVSFATQLALFHSQLQVMVDEVFRPVGFVWSMWSAWTLLPMPIPLMRGRRICMVASSLMLALVCRRFRLPL
jgi:hypothetical protein